MGMTASNPGCVKISLGTFLGQHDRICSAWLMPTPDGWLPQLTTISPPLHQYVLPLG